MPGPDELHLTQVEDYDVNILSSVLFTLFTRRWEKEARILVGENRLCGPNSLRTIGYIQAKIHELIKYKKTKRSRSFCPSTL